MIKLYGSMRSSAARCAWFAEELGLPYEMVAVDFQKGEHKTPEYLKLNPNGKVPTMVDGDFVLWESLAICYYLMEKKQDATFVGTTPEEHGVVNQWSLWAMMHLYGNGFGPIFMQKWRNMADNEVFVNAREVELPRYLKILEDRLDGREYVALDHFSLADLVVMSVVGGAVFMNYDLLAYPHITAWVKRVSDRPAYKKVMGL